MNSQNAEPTAGLHQVPLQLQDTSNLPESSLGGCIVRKAVVPETSVDGCFSCHFVKGMMCQTADITL